MYDLASKSIRRLSRGAAFVTIAFPTLGFLGCGLLLVEGKLLPSAIWLFLILYFLTTVGVEIGLHRLFSHQSFSARPVARTALAILGSMAAQGPVMFWVAIHRRHHAFTDRPGDPHSPNLLGDEWSGRLRGLLHAHLGWLFSIEVVDYSRYALDLLRDRRLFTIHRLYPLWVILGLVVPAALGGALSGSFTGVWQGFLAGGLARMFAVHHVTWIVNSLGHQVGNRPTQRRDRSTNSGWLMLPTLGASWHHNHHAAPGMATTSRKPWQLDPCFWVIRLLAAVGLASDVHVPGRFAVEATADEGGADNVS